MNHLRARKLSNVLIVVGAFLAFSLYAIGQVNALFIAVAVASFVCVGGGFVVLSIWYRCKSCKKPLPFRAYVEPDICPFCREKLIK